MRVFRLRLVTPALDGAAGGVHDAHALLWTVGVHIECRLQPLVKLFRLRPIAHNDLFQQEVERTNRRRFDVAVVRRLIVVLFDLSYLRHCRGSDGTQPERQAGNFL